MFPHPVRQRCVLDGRGEGDIPVSVSVGQMFQSCGGGRLLRGQIVNGHADTLGRISLVEIHLLSKLLQGDHHASTDLQPVDTRGTPFPRPDLHLPERRGRGCSTCADMSRFDPFICFSLGQTKENYFSQMCWKNFEGSSSRGKTCQR